MKRVVCCVVSSCMLMGCQAPASLSMPQPPHLPAMWGEYSIQRFGASNCPDISGQYKRKPEKYSWKSGESIFLEGSETDFYQVIPFSLAKKSTNEALQPDQTGSPIIIEQLSADIFIFSNYWADGTALSSFTFKSEEGDFHCEGGSIVFPDMTEYGQIEGAGLNGQIHKQLRRAQDGSLIAIYSFGPYKSRRQPPINSFNHQYFRFRPF